MELATRDITQLQAETARGLDMVPLSLQSAALLASGMARCVDPEYHGHTQGKAAAVLEAAECMAESMHPALYEDGLFKRAVKASAVSSAQLFEGRRPMETMFDAALRVLTTGVERWQRLRAAGRR